jgi:hypothetical protein
MRIMIIWALALTSISVFAFEKDPCGVAYETGNKNGMFNFLERDSLSLDEMKLISKIEKRLILSHYHIVAPKAASYMISGTNGNGEYSLVFQKLQGKTLLYKTAVLDTWPFSLTERVMRRNVVSWAKKIPLCQE